MHNNKNKAIALLLSLSCLATSNILASDVSIITTKKVYQVPVKYIDDHESMIKHGKLLEVGTIEQANDDSVFEYKNVAIIFPTSNKYQNMNILLDAIAEYSKGLDNVSHERVKNVLSVLKVDKGQE